MNEEEVRRRIADGQSAAELLNLADPKLRRRFQRAAQTLARLMEDVQSHFPDAEYYTAGGGLTLLLGRSHRDEGTHTVSQREMVADVAMNGLIIGDGDW